MVDGMRYAIASGMMAAQPYLAAAVSGSFREKNLSRYRDLLTPVYEDVNRSGRDSFISESGFVYRTLPRLLFGSNLLSHKVEIKAEDGSRERVPHGTDAVTYVEGGEFRTPSASPPILLGFLQCYIRMAEAVWSHQSMSYSYLERLERTIKQHEEWRVGECLNLIPSENQSSSHSRSVFMTDLGN